MILSARAQQHRQPGFRGGKIGFGGLREQPGEEREAAKMEILSPSAERMCAHVGRGSHGQTVNEPRTVARARAHSASPALPVRRRAPRLLLLPFSTGEFVRTSPLSCARVAEAYLRLVLSFI